MILIIATLLIALVVFSLTSIYSSYVASNTAISNFAESVAEGLYITKTTAAVGSSSYSIVIVPEDFNYNGTIYLTAISVPPSLYGINDISPYQGSFNVLINGTMAKSQSVILYTSSLHELYQGQAPIWKSVTGAPQTITVPLGYDAVVFVFVPTPKGLVEVGYVWLEK